jgi:hypothetical protein
VSASYDEAGIAQLVFEDGSIVQLADDPNARTVHHGRIGVATVRHDRLLEFEPLSPDHRSPS